MSTPAAQPTPCTPADWRAVVANLQARYAAAEAAAEALDLRRGPLMLDAALGIDGAAEALRKVHHELDAARNDAEAARMAVAQANERKQAAERAEAEAAETERCEEMATQARLVLKHAAQFTTAVHAAARAAATVRDLLAGMRALARPDEMHNINRCSERGAYMRCAEAAGLRGCIEFQPYTGAREHLQPLETALAAYLARWIPQQEKQEQEKQE